jgi:hypothetical protein
VTWVDRAWFSRAWRVAAAAAAVAAVALQAMPDAEDSIRGEPTPQAMADAQVIDDAGRDLGLPASAARALAHRTLTVARGTAADQTRLALQALVVEGEIK